MEHKSSERPAGTSVQQVAPVFKSSNSDVLHFPNCAVNTAIDQVVQSHTTAGLLPDRALSLYLLYSISS